MYINNQPAMVVKWINKVVIDEKNTDSELKEKCFMAMLGKPIDTTGQNLLETIVSRYGSRDRYGFITNHNFGDVGIHICAEKIAELQTENKQLREEMAELKKAFTDLLDAMLHSKQSES